MSGAVRRSIVFFSSIRRVSPQAVACVAGLALLQSCVTRNVEQAPRTRTAVPSSNERAAVARADVEQVVREALEELGTDVPVDAAQEERWFRAVESLGQAGGGDSLDLLFAALLASHNNLRLQRAALFSLVRRAPGSLQLARILLDSELPRVSGLVHSFPELTLGQRRTYERGLAAAVLGLSGLPAVREPLLDALSKATDSSERALLVIALTNLERHADPPALLLRALDTIPIDAQPSVSLKWGLTHLVPAAETLLLPCSFEIMRLKEPALLVEVLAMSAADRANEQVGPRLLKLAERATNSNREAAMNLVLASATLAGPKLLGTVEERARRLRSDNDVWTDDFVKDLAKAYSTCHEDLACHLRVLGGKEEGVEPWRYKSAQFVAARLPSDKGLQVLVQMENMPRPDRLAIALDQRLSHPTKAEVSRVAKLARQGATLYVPRGQCSALRSPLDELAIRLEVRNRIN